jgi:hypothetical protein
MPTIRFSREDINSRKQLPPNWYKMELREVTEETAKDGQSTNWVCKFIVTEAKDPDAVGTVIRHWFNEKAMGRVIDFLRCFLGGDVEEGASYELNDVIGQPVLGFVKYDPERKWNSIEDFRKA